MASHTPHENTQILQHINTVWGMKTPTDQQTQLYLLSWFIQLRAQFISDLAVFNFIWMKHQPQPTEKKEKSHFSNGQKVSHQFMCRRRRAHFGLLHRDKDLRCAEEKGYRKGIFISGLRKDTKINQSLPPRPGERVTRRGNVKQSNVWGKVGENVWGCEGGKKGVKCKKRGGERKN